MVCTNPTCSHEAEDARYKQCERCRRQRREAKAKERQRDPEAVRARGREAMRLHRARDPERAKERQRAFHRRRRGRVLAYYGGKCACCGEDRYEFLTLDHKNGGGTQHRLELKARGNTMVGWIIANNFPDLFRVLCHNCNGALGFYGYCPHEQERTAV